jgi:hypothetical protein
VNSIFIVWTAALGTLGPILCFFGSRRYVLYVFVLFSVFSPTIYGFMSAANLLPGGRAASVLDVLFLFLLVIAYPITRKDVYGREFSGIDLAVLILTLLVVLNFFVGYYRRGALSGVLNITREFLFIPVYFAAANILSNPKNVKLLYKLILWFTIGVFIFHVLIMFRMYVPPMFQSATERYEMEKYTAIVRPYMFFGEFFYIVSAAVALSHIKNSDSKKIFYYFILILSLLGTIFTQTRSLYGAMVLALFAFFAFGKNKLKTVMYFMVTGIIFAATLLIFQKEQVDIFARFKVTRDFADAWRAGEYGSIVNVLIEQPMGFLTGQGFGALHTVTGRTIPYFHNEYLQSIFSLGIIGFACYCYIIFSTIMRGRQLCEDRQMALILMPVRITFFALAGMAFYFPVLWSTKNCALVIAFAAISRNSYWLASQGPDNQSYENELIETELYPAFNE